MGKWGLQRTHMNMAIDMDQNQFSHDITYFFEVLFFFLWF